MLIQQYKMIFLFYILLLYNKQRNDLLYVTKNCFISHKPCFSQRTFSADTLGQELAINDERVLREYFGIHKFNY